MEMMMIDLDLFMEILGDDLLARCSVFEDLKGNIYIVTGQ